LDVRISRGRIGDQCIVRAEVSVTVVRKVAPQYFDRIACLATPFLHANIRNIWYFNYESFKTAGASSGVLITFIINICVGNVGLLFTDAVWRWAIAWILLPTGGWVIGASLGAILQGHLRSSCAM
jgi:hypothetical protein